MRAVLLATTLGVATLLTACSHSSPATNNTTFGAQQMQTMTVAQAKTLHDDALVSLEGNIVTQIGGEKYTFKDRTGELTVEIDHDKWNGLNVSPTDVVVIYGEIDKEWSNTKVDVKRIHKK